MVYEIHSLLGDEVERDSLGRGLVSRHTKDGEKGIALRHAAAVIVLGEPVKQVVVDEKGVPADRVSVIYPGIDLAEYEAVGRCDNPGYRADHKVVMYVGSIVHPNQGVPILIDALPRVFEADPLVRCVLVGGPAEAGVAYQAQLGPYGDRLTVLSGQTPEQVVALSRGPTCWCTLDWRVGKTFRFKARLPFTLRPGRPIVATDFGDYRTLLGTTGRGPVDGGRSRSHWPRESSRSWPTPPGRKPGRSDGSCRSRALCNGPQHRSLPGGLSSCDRHRPALIARRGSGESGTLDATDCLSGNGHVTLRFSASRHGFGRPGSVPDVEPSP